MNVREKPPIAAEPVAVHAQPKPAMDARTRALLKDPIGPTLFRMAWPNVLVMFAQAATGLIETFWVGMLGLVMLSSAGVAIGLMWSSFTESQILSYFATMLTLIALYAIGSVSIIEFAQGWAGDALSFISLQSRFDSFARGILGEFTPQGLVFRSQAAQLIIHRGPRDVGEARRATAPVPSCPDQAHWLLRACRRGHGRNCGRVPHRALVR